MTSTTKSLYAGHRFPPELISYTVWLYFRFPLSLRMVEEMLAFRGIEVSHETIRQWALKFGQEFANIIRRRLPRPGDKWHMDEVVLKIAGKKHYLWRAVDQHGVVLDVLVQSRRDKKAAKRLLRKLLKRQCRAPRVMITDKLGSYGAAKKEIMPGVEHRQHKGLNNQLTPANKATRTADEAVQVGPTGSALPLHPRSDQQPLPPAPPPHACNPRRTHPRLRGVARCLRHQASRIARSTPGRRQTRPTLGFRPTT